MEQNKHTKGPWLYSVYPGGDVGVYPQGGNGRDIAIVRDNLANAALIAAAPDMLSALESAENALHNLTAHNAEADPIDLATLATVRAAIARAKGE